MGSIRKKTLEKNKKSDKNCSYLNINNYYTNSIFFLYIKYMINLKKYLKNSPKISP